MKHKLESRIKIAGRNINNLRHADGTTLMAEREEELKSLFFFFLVNEGTIFIFSFVITYCFY